MMLLVVVLTGTAAPALAQSKADGAPEPATGRTAKKAVYASRFMVVAANPHAARAGLEILRRGGSAADAAIAVQLVLNLVEPQSSGIGGGAFSLYWQASSRKLVTYDGRETAPRAATPGLFRDNTGKLLPYRTAVRTGRAVGVPGTVALMWQLHKAHGRLPWARLFLPAIRLAERGFKVSPRLHGLLRDAFFLRRRAATRAYFFTAAGQPLPVGYVRTNPAFAATLRLIATQGPNAFYRGDVARDIASAVQAAQPWPGVLTETDMTRYAVVVRPPVCAPYRRWRVCGMGPPSSGGLAVAQILGQLGRFDLGKMGLQTASSLHVLIEASRRAFADRNRYVADPEFASVPVRRMLDPAYLRRRGGSIDPARAGGRATPGRFPVKKGALPGRGRSLEIPATSHISIVDGDGNAISMTTTIEAAFGSGIMVRGFLLNNELTDFSFRSARAGSPVANRVEGGKRPRSSMAPTMVFGRKGRLAMVTGSPGGSRIIGYVAGSIIAVLDWKMNAQAAADLPHVLSRNGPAEVEKGAPSALVAALRALGHKVGLARMTSGLHIIRRLPDGRLEGGADPRREGIALGD
jgi:gamma-glutamyltranspeptidase/glutathione hydrolase